MFQRQASEDRCRARGFVDLRWIDPASVVVAEWVRMKCLSGCGEYGRNSA